MTTGADRFGVDPWRSEAGERIHPNGSAVGGIAGALDPAPYHRPLGRPAGRAGSPTGRPEQSGRCAACPSSSSGLTSTRGTRPPVPLLAVHIRGSAAGGVASAHDRVGHRTVPFAG